MKYLRKDDPEIAALVGREEERIENTLNLIAAENYPPRSIMEIMGSIFNIKTIEGYPGRRFHAGCSCADAVERLAVERAKALFGAEYVNVQPHSGTSANLAVYFSVLEVGDRILAMSLPHGGQLSHGHCASITSKCFDFRHYGLDPETEHIDYGEVRSLAQRFNPKMIVVGASSYPRLIDYREMARIAGEVSAYLLADMAHIAGLVAARVIPSPVPHCDFVTFTVYKTMMGGRGGVILSREKYGRRLDTAVFPGCQGTSAVNAIAAKAFIFRQARQPDFVNVQRSTLENAVQLAAAFERKNYRIVTGGTQTHQVIVDLASRGLDGNTAEQTLESVGIITNRNFIPRDAAGSGKPSGIRLGTGVLSARGMGASEMVRIADLIDTAMSGADNPEALHRASRQVLEICVQFPAYRSQCVLRRPS